VKISVKLVVYKSSQIVEKMPMAMMDVSIYGIIQMMRILVSLLNLGIAWKTNDHYGPGWNWLINLTFFESIIPVFYTVSVSLDEIFDDVIIQILRILLSLLTLGIAFAINDLELERLNGMNGWNSLINLTY
jgi:hypothetical protein